ncbi:hypothetical protein CVT25_010213 [Psilocybe cyanescens]|uniref:Methyltransferase type 11 domain-containing protein n=1 Tax=Psilocybe cyanescens TaxID=93625 RepID=A0A409XD92_PSICY|nr:hypothetical protein CVT25_010213 [Psilocybe cyanescens]
MSDSGTTAFVLSSGVLLLITLLVSLRMRSKDPYGLFHLTLNKLPSQDPKLPPATEWLNMGYWKNTQSFPAACQDVGHGTGESLLLLLSEPSLPQLSHLVGVTSLEVHHQRSVERVQKYQKVHNTDTIVDLYHADAICTSSGAFHPLSVFSEETFDSILALDCAYHFKTRRLFLEQAHDKLVPGGTVALADICFSSQALETRWTRSLTSILRLMPRDNMISKEDYVVQLQQIGYIDVVLEDITANVFPSFSRFLKSQGWGWWVLGTVIDWYASAGARFVIISGKKATSTT